MKLLRPKLKLCVVRLLNSRARIIWISFIGLVLTSLGVGAGPMSFVPKGRYRPLYVEPVTIKPADKKKLSKLEQQRKLRLKRGKFVEVPAFYLDRLPVTRIEFQRFVMKNPLWQKSKVLELYADQTYLSDWPSQLEIGSEQDSQSPVRFVSWFAARAYCESLGGRLPTIVEWERAGSAYADFDRFKKKILEWYGEPTPKKIPRVGSTFVNKFGVYDLHGLHWEWVEDFNSNLVTGESRGDSSLERDAFCGSSGLGAADFEDYAAFMRFGFRSSLKGAYTIANLGFRCAKDAR